MSETIGGFEKVLDPSYDLGNAVNRPEKIVILPYNTLRFMDAPIQAEIDNANGDNKEETFDDFLFRLISRSEKELAIVNNVDKQVLDELVDAQYQYYYKLAPRTELYGMLDVLKHQQFVNSITVLYPKRDMTDDNDVFTIDYYNDYLDLVNWLRYHDWTCLIIGDVDLLDQLTMDGNIDFNNKTVFISKTGYNYYFDNNNLPRMRKYKAIIDRYLMELCTFKLFSFENKGGNS